MPTNEQRRQAAKRKLQRQLANRAARARRRRIFAVVGTVVLVLLAVAGIYWLASGNGSDAAAQQTQASSTTSAAPAETTGGPCKYATTPDQPAAKPVEPPADPDPTPKDGTVETTFKTDQGDIPVTLDRAKAPCTVQSIVHLAEAKFYDGTPCHRIVHKDNFKVLQCGDPTGKGSGGPGYTIPDEKPTNLQPAPAEAGGGGASVYPRGTIAMAKTAQPNSGGSQFFMVYGSTFLPPEYTIFGTIAEPGLTVLDKIGAGGVDDSANPGSGDGAPKLATKITEVTVAG